MMNNQSRKTRIWGAVLLFMAMLIVGFDVNARDIPWGGKTVNVSVQGQALSTFLPDFFAQRGIAVELSDRVTGQVSGRFADKPQKIFADLRKAYNLVSYYDGRTLHIGTAADLQTETISVKPSQTSKLMKVLVALDLSDRQQSIKVDSKSGQVVVRGIAPFIEHARQKILEATKQPTKKPTARTKPVIIAKSLPTAKPQIVFRSFALSYATAADVTYQQNGEEIVIPGVATLLKKMLGDSQSLRTRRITGRVNQTVPGLRGKGLKQYDAQTVAVNQTAQTGDQEFVFSTAGTAENRASVVKVEADRNLNAVIVKGYADAMPMYADLIQQLDKEPQLVEIRVTIIDVDKSKLQDLGFDWRYQGSNSSSRFGGGDAVDTDGGFGGLLLNTVLGDSRRFFASIRALAESGSARVVSRPQVLTLSNLEAVLQNDQSFFVRIAGNEEVDLFNVSAGTSLRVVPQVVGNANQRKIRLLVSIEDGTVVPGATVDDIPVIENSTLSTQAIIYDGEDLLLGGLVRETSRTTDSKVPVLGDIPAVGNLFKRTSTDTNRTERLFLISPRIVGNQRGSRNLSPQQPQYQQGDKRGSGHRQLLSSISPVYDNPMYYSESGQYRRSGGAIYQSRSNDKRRAGYASHQFSSDENWSESAR